MEGIGSVLVQASVHAIEHGLVEEGLQAALETRHIKDLL